MSEQEFYDKSYLDWLIPVISKGCILGMSLAALYVTFVLANWIIEVFSNEQIYQNSDRKKV